jgi:hypothetical protein
MELQIFTTKNAIMANCLQELITSIDSNSVFQCEISDLSEALLSRFVIHQGGYLLEYALLKGFVPNPEQEFIPSQSLLDRTGYECSKNHLHTRDLLEDDKKGLHHLLAGIIFADNLRYKLKSKFPFSKFKIIVGFSVFPLSKGDNEIKNDCTIRFHSIRDGESIYDNLENFKTDAVGIIEV